MIEDLLKQGDKIADSYEVLSLLSKGRIGAVYKARDSFGRLYTVKIFGKRQTQNFPEYTNHLEEINRSLKVVLSKLAKFPNISQMIEIGETEEYFFQVEEFIDAQSLDSVIKAEAPLNPTKALYVVAQLAEALHFLHSNSIIHADVKPTNILLYEPPPNALDKNMQVKLIDFGMAQKIESNQGILFVGTYRYIHPELKGRFRQDRNATTETSKSSFYMSSIGPYIDIYALGLVSLEMLIGKTQNSFLITESRISLILQENNPILRRANEAIRKELSHLVFEMLSVKLTGNNISTKSIFEKANVLINKFRTVETSYPFTLNDGSEQTHSETCSLESKTLQRLENLMESLADATAAFWSRDRHLEILEVPQAESEILNEMNKVFSNALARSKNSWRVTVGMTITSFVTIIGMVFTAVIMTILTGNSGWALIFGGASVPLILGTLIWRPFDRMFRATILSQQLEMIHFQTITGFRSTKDLDRRIQLCKEAVLSLEALFNKHASSE